MDDDELIAALAAGDDAALRELFTRHAPWLAARLRAALPPPDVEDVLQETFLAVWQGAGGYRPRGHAAGLDVGDRPQPGRAPAAQARPGHRAARGPAPLDAPQPGLDPAEAAAGPAPTSPPRSAGPDGEVLRLMYVEDRPVAEVAALLGVPAGTVKSRAHRARRLLRARPGRNEMSIPNEFGGSPLRP